MWEGEGEEEGEGKRDVKEETIFLVRKCTTVIPGFL